MFLGDRKSIGPQTAVAFLNIYFYERNLRIAKTKGLEVFQFIHEEPGETHSVTGDDKVDSAELELEGDGSDDPAPCIECINFEGVGFCNKEKTNPKVIPNLESGKDESVKCLAYINAAKTLRMDHKHLTPAEIIFDYDFSHICDKLGSKCTSLSSLQDKMRTLGLVCIEEPCSPAIAVQRTLDELGMQPFEEDTRGTRSKKLIDQCPIGEKDLGKALQFLSDKLKHLLVLVHPNTNQIYHVFHPSETSPCMTVIVIGSIDGRCFPSKLTEIDEDLGVSCTCGRKGTVGAKACTKPLCKCLARGQPCTKDCICKGCDNPYGKRPTELPKAKFCQCKGKTGSCKTLRCACVSNKVQCNEKCYCTSTSCVNGKTSDAAPSPRRQMDKLSAGKVPRLTSSKFLAFGGVQLKEERWTEKEEIILRICARARVQAGVYPTYHKTSEELRNMRLAVRVHPKTKVTAKIRHLKLGDK